MKIKSIYKKIAYIFSALLLLCFMTFNCITVKADESFTKSYTSVMEDLQKDESFNVANYPEITDPANEDIYSLEIIQIAESATGELFIYVYQPCNSVFDLKATSISMSYGYSSNGEGLDPYLYDLELISTYNQFDKYLVKNYQVSNDAERYYNIVTIYREFNPFIDKPISGTDEDNEIGLSVGQQWLAYYLNDKIVYEMGTFKTLEIEITYTGNFEFASGIKWGSLVGSFDYGLSWFVCFNVEEYVIQHIYDADLSYRKRSMSWSVGLGLTGEESYGEWSDYIKVRLKDTDKVTYDGGGLFSKEYNWNRIATGKDFLQNAESQDVTISDECKNALNESQWVFAFTETELETFVSSYSTSFFSSDIDDVAILKIHFLDVNNKIYDLGVVSDKVNPDNVSDGQGSGVDFDWLADVLGWILGIGLLALLVVVLLNFFPWVIALVGKGIVTVFKWIIKAIWFVMCLPFKLIGKLFKRKKR